MATVFARARLPYRRAEPVWMSAAAAALKEKIYGTYGTSAELHLARADPQALTRDQREHIGVHPRRRRALAGAGKDAQTASQPARLAAHAASRVALDPPAALGDLADAH